MPQLPLPTRPTLRRRSRSGFTLVETTVFLAVLMLGLLALTSTTMTVHKLRASDRDQRAADLAMQSCIGEIRALSNSLTGPNWSQALVDALAEGGTSGNRFNVPGLEPVGAADAVGSIEVLVDELVSDADVRFELGLPRDLDGDGLTLTADVSATARLLPVIVRARWQTARGVREHVQGFFLLGF